MSKELSFPPYKNYVGTIDYIDDFVQISDLSYGLTKQLMIKHERDTLKEINIPLPPKKELFFSMADVQVKDVEIICGWLTFEKYANKVGTTEQVVERDANSGLLGPITEHPETKCKLVIWPQEFQKEEIQNLPPAGKTKYKPTVSITASAGVEIDTDNPEKFEETQKQLIRLAHAVGDKHEVSTKAETMLYQSSFLLQWTAFEVFIRETIHELYKLHPVKLTKGQKGSVTSLSYAEVYEMSENLTSMDSLRESIVNREIEKHKKDGASISGLINFLKSEFKFEVDPYEAWYVFGGDKKAATFNKIIEIKDVRNSLIHDAGKEVDELLRLYPHLNNKDGELIISKEYYSETLLVLRSIAYSVARSIVTGKYRSA